MDCETCEKRENCPIKDAKKERNLYKMVAALVEVNGFRVLLDTQYCKQFHSSHDNNCVGCEGEQGCRKIMCVLRAFDLLGVLPDEIVAAIVEKILEEDKQ